ncbi:MAG: hypothetical protein ACU84H_12410 [Gammaproteobacteria bacterium]
MKFRRFIKWINSILLLAMILLIVYLVKSAMGINLFPHYSLGIWRYFKPYFDLLRHWF